MESEASSTGPPTVSGVFILLPMLTGNRRSHHGDVLKIATRLVEEGKLRPIVDPRHFTLDQAIEAHDAVQDRSANIKVVIDVI